MAHMMKNFAYLAFVLSAAAALSCVALAEEAADDFASLYAIAREEEAIGALSKADLQLPTERQKALDRVMDAYRKGFRSRAAWTLFVIENAERGLSRADADSVKSAWAGGERGYLLDLEKHVLDLEFRGLKFAASAKAHLDENGELSSLLETARKEIKDQSEAATRTLRQAQEKAKADVEAVRETLAAAEARNAKMSEAMEKLVAANRKAVEAMGRKDKTIAELKSAAVAAQKAMTATNSALSTERAALSAERAKSAKAISELKASLDGARKSLNATNAAFAAERAAGAKSVAEIRSALDAASKKAAELEKELATLRSETEKSVASVREESQKAVATARSEAEAAKAEAAHQTAEAKRCREELDNARRECAMRENALQKALDDKRALELQLQKPAAGTPGLPAEAQAEAPAGADGNQSAETPAADANAQDTPPAAPNAVSAESPAAGAAENAATNAPANGLGVESLLNNPDAMLLAPAKSEAR